MTTKINIAIAQIAVKQTDINYNLMQAEELIAAAARRQADIIAFPEMWTTGFNWEENKKIATQQQTTLNKIQNLAKHYRIWITGSILYFNHAGQPTNTAILVNSAGELIATYSKIHLFSLLHEDLHVAAGDHLTVVPTPWGKIGLTVCYDIRFPELFRSLALEGAEIIFSPMAFPFPRLEHWQVLVRARAIENQLFMVGVNQIGNEDFGADGVVTYFGHSCIIDPWGKTCLEVGEAEMGLFSVTIDLALAKQIRQKMSALTDRRPQLYKLS